MVCFLAVVIVAVVDFVFLLMRPSFVSTVACARGFSLSEVWPDPPPRAHRQFSVLWFAPNKKYGFKRTRSALSSDRERE